MEEDNEVVEGGNQEHPTLRGARHWFSLLCQQGSRKDYEWPDKEKVMDVINETKKLGNSIEDAIFKNKQRVANQYFTDLRVATQLVIYDVDGGQDLVMKAFSRFRDPDSVPKLDVFEVIYPINSKDFGIQSPGGDPWVVATQYLTLALLERNKEVVPQSLKNEIVESMRGSPRQTITQVRRKLESQTGRKII